MNHSRMDFGQVFFDRTVMHATVIATLAMVRLDSCVHSQVNFEIRFACEEFLAFGTSPHAGLHMKRFDVLTETR